MSNERCDEIHTLRSSKNNPVEFFALLKCLTLVFFEHRERLLRSQPQETLDRLGVDFG